MAALKDAQGWVTAPGFYDGAQSLSDDECQSPVRIPYSAADIVSETGASQAFGKPGLTINERRWMRPTLEVNRTWSGYTGLDSKTVISATVHAKITSQLVAYQEPMKAIQSVQVAVHAAASPGALASLISLGAVEARVTAQWQPAAI
ncbi:MAG: peptidase dimerization domain-containing protein [Chloroflexi bacterium]|nr:peptidase dimerization domain-containing protein [Chloroflexota bacterium]